jgi:hypothetical protein
MMIDADEMTPGGRTWRQMWADLAKKAGAATVALASMQGKSARWWRYMVSQQTFEMVIGEPLGEDNIVLCLPGCMYLAGPVRWPHQQIEVTYTRESDNPAAAGKFTLQDPSVGFRAVGGGFQWQRNFAITARHGLYNPRGAGSFPPATIEQTLEALETQVREFYNGKLTYDQLPGFRMPLAELFEEEEK